MYNINNLIVNIKSDLKALENEVSTNSSAISAINATLDDVDLALKDLDDRVTALENPENNKKKGE